MVVAPDFVTVVMGGKWRAAVPVLQVLSVVALAVCLAQVGQRVLGALDRTSFVFRFSLVETPLTIGAFALGLKWGLVGVVVCYALVSVPLQAIYIAFTARAVGIPLGAVCRTLSGVAVATLLMTVACIAVRLSLLAAGVGSGARLAFVIVTGAIVYALSCWMLEPQVVREIKAVRRRRSGSTSLAVVT
jgi:PST family polysaccharide transporter